MSKRSEATFSVHGIGGGLVVVDVVTIVVDSGSLVVVRWVVVVSGSTSEHKSPEKSGSLVIDQPLSSQQPTLNRIFFPLSLHCPLQIRPFLRSLQIHFPSPRGYSSRAASALQVIGDGESVVSGEPVVDSPSHRSPRNCLSTNSHPLPVQRSP